MALDKRSNGILMHVSSLPSEYGIGKLGKEAVRFIDFLKRCGTEYWQILPLSQTSYGDSPYQSFSIHAGNPYFIDFEQLEEENLLRKNDYAKFDWGNNPRRVDYEKIYQNTYPILRKAYERSLAYSQEEFEEFKEENAYWLDNYSLFMSLKDAHNGKPWYEWETGYAFCKKSKMEQAREELKTDIDYYSWMQFVFYKQWKKIKEYANSKGIKIIGDMPIYVSYDSTEVWTEPDLFFLNSSKEPTAVAGCPPDSFSATGQLWGNPVYNWKYHAKTGYKWWKERINSAKELYDVIRIDHFRGFESYYAIPFGSKTAEIGQWFKGPGMKLFDAIKEETKDIDIIAEDLGFVTPEVRKLLDETGFPGMKVLQFAFDGTGKSEYIPHNFKNSNCVCYTGTHDNETLLGWIDSLESDNLKYVKRYFRVRNSKDIPEEMIRCAWSSTANLAIAQIQDFLSSPASSRMNTPSTLGGNWEFRTVNSDFGSRLSKHINELNAIYNR